MVLLIKGFVFSTKDVYTSYLVNISYESWSSKPCDRNYTGKLSSEISCEKSSAKINGGDEMIGVISIVYLFTGLILL